MTKLDTNKKGNNQDKDISILEHLPGLLMPWVQVYTLKKKEKENFVKSIIPTNLQVMLSK